MPTHRQAILTQLLGGCKALSATGVTDEQFTALAKAALQNSDAPNGIELSLFITNNMRFMALLERELEALLRESP